MTDNQDKELNLHEIQQEALKVLKRFDLLCKEHNWTYFITYGTLLGAVRHQGFIPWDDDVDVQMPRKDFDEMVQWCKNNSDSIKPFKLCDRETVNNYPFGIPRFSNMNFIYVNTNVRYLPFDIGVFLDIYPFDNYCSNAKSALKLKKKIDNINLYVRAYISATAAGNFIISFCKKIMHFFLHLIKSKNYPKQADDKIKKLVRKYTSDKDFYIGCPVWNEGFYQCKREWFSETLELKFEDSFFPVPVGYDEFLKIHYKNYLELPPEEKRVPYHDYKIYRRNE